MQPPITNRITVLFQLASFWTYGVTARCSGTVFIKSRPQWRHTLASSCIYSAQYRHFFINQSFLPEIRLLHDPEAMEKIHLGRSTTKTKKPPGSRAVPLYPL